MNPKSFKPRYLKHVDGKMRANNHPFWQLIFKRAVRLRMSEASKNRDTGFSLPTINATVFNSSVILARQFLILSSFEIVVHALCWDAEILKLYEQCTYLTSLCHIF